MSAFVRFAAPALLTCFAEAAVAQQWTSLGGPEGPSLRMVAASPHPGGPWIAAGLAAWISQDDAASWRLADGVTGGLFEVAFHPFDSDLVYASSVHGFVFSEDGGRRWRHRSVSYSAEAFWENSIDPTDTRRFYVIGQISGVGGLLRSDDEGASWTWLGTVDDDDEYRDVLALADGSVLSARESGIDRSTDLGVQFRHQLSARVTELDACRNQPREVWAVGSRLVARSHDSGLTWSSQQAPFGFPFSLAVDPIDRSAHVRRGRPMGTGALDEHGPRPYLGGRR